LGSSKASTIAIFWPSQKGLLVDGTINCQNLAIKQYLT